MTVRKCEFGEANAGLRQPESHWKVYLPVTELSFVMMVSAIIAAEKRRHVCATPIWYVRALFSLALVGVYVTYMAVTCRASEQPLLGRHGTEALVAMFLSRTGLPTKLATITLQLAIGLALPVGGAKGFIRGVEGSRTADHDVFARQVSGSSSRFPLERPMRSVLDATYRCTRKGRNDSRTPAAARARAALSSDPTSPAKRGWPRVLLRVGPALL
ncbi:hypothetical protein OKW50_006807 [Paraburkholderia youngii]|uniref:hypothetical protein n=1 Tax=Paraburkholderia youngii TaxID=2782701 RepID=UPI003D1A2D08